VVEGCVSMQLRKDLTYWQLHGLGSLSRTHGQTD